eukprot:CAMPEP_0118956474 /NCGR_PEP_ID=MMETSP1169-20130426/61600_1 /TAXON_ID=36882 /ORGANISM="Pyramimonas obovata, Strain CCMP722" /LENGTH=160 /DNA_ID=CAMNT_0006904507 /DNA_START=723 /DNA_END=1205 /DNA_ORIENTATION=-
MAAIAFSTPTTVVAKATPAGRTQRTVSRAARPMLAGSRAVFYRPARLVASRQSVRVAAKEGEEFEVPEVVTETLDKVTAAWDATDDKPAVISLAGFGVVGLVALAGVLKGIESLPLVSDFLEVVGISYSLWFTYRYLLFKPDREELKAKLSVIKEDVLGK